MEALGFPGHSVSFSAVQLGQSLDPFTFVTSSPTGGNLFGRQDFGSPSEQGMDPVFVEFHWNGHRFEGHVNFIGPVLCVILEHLPIGDGFGIE